MVLQMLQLMGTMMLFMLVGWVVRKKKIVTNAGKQCLTDLILFVILPCNIITAFMNGGTDGLWRALSQVLVIAALIQLLCSVLAAFAYRRMNPGERKVFQYATVCSNAGFLGNPMTQSVFGNLGLLYASIYLIPQRIVMWTAGISYFTEASGKKSLLKKVLTHPCMVAVYIGMVLMLGHWRLPGVLYETINGFSRCTTAMTMMYIGTILADVQWRTVLSGKQLYYALIRLVLIPLLVYLPCRLLHVDALVGGVSVFLAAMPAGSTTSLLAAKYGADEEAAAKCVVLTTALSVFTLPLWGMLLTAALD